MNDRIDLPLFQLGSSIPPQPPSDTPYYEAIGRFVVGYAIAESSVHLLVRKLSGLNDAKARLIFSGMTIRQVAHYARTLIGQARLGEKTKDRLISCLDQLDLAGKQRDKMVHRYVDCDGGKVTVDNFFTAKSVLNVEKDILSLNDLRNLHIDCVRISLLLSYFYSPRIGRDQAFVRRVRQMTWQYKPPQQGSGKKRSRREARKAPQRPRPSSRA